MIRSLELCPKSQRHLKAYNERKQAEYALVQNYDTKDTGDGKYWYLVDAVWVNNWKRYVRSEMVTDIRDMEAPGPVTNSRLFEKDEPTRPRQKLKLKIHYIGVNARVWWLFMHVHGGGPVVCREDLNVYSNECHPELDLVPEELSQRNSTQFLLGPSNYQEDRQVVDSVSPAQRLSYQFVDECKGDCELYLGRYTRQCGGAGYSSGSSSAYAPSAACEAPVYASAQLSLESNLQLGSLSNTKSGSSPSWEPPQTHHPVPVPGEGFSSDLGQGGSPESDSSVSADIQRDPTRETQSKIEGPELYMDVESST